MRNLVSYDDISFILRSMIPYTDTLFHNANIVSYVDIWFIMRDMIPHVDI